MQKIRSLVLLATVAALTACGGGGGENAPEPTPTPTPVAGTPAPAPAPTPSPTADAVDKYLGNWGGCASDVSINGYVKITYTIGKQSANTGTFKMSALEGNASALVVYSDASCTVIKPLTSFKPNQDVLGFSIAGSTTIEGKTADKIDISAANGTAKAVWLNTGNQLLIGWINPGADGYPTTLSLPVTKR
jgi:hypothetical protein